jgi:hypothetical protein
MDRRTLRFVSERPRKSFYFFVTYKQNCRELSFKPYTVHGSEKACRKFRDQMAQPAIVAPPRLNSWKEIASYLGRGVRTVQRWERELQLPIHRIGSGPRSPVYALTSELNFWMRTSGAMRNGENHATTPLKPLTGKPVEDSHRLTSNIHNLVQSIAENSVRHQRQAEILQKHILEMRSRLR